MPTLAIKLRHKLRLLSDTDCNAVQIAAANNKTAKFMEYDLCTYYLYLAHVVAGMLSIIYKFSYCYMLKYLV